MNKIAQRTKLDEELEKKRDSKHRQPQQEVLPLYDPNWEERIEEEKNKNKMWVRNIYKDEKQQEFEKSLEERAKKPRPRQPIDLNYPQLFPEQIKVRPLTEPEEKRLSHEEEYAEERLHDYYPYGGSDYAREYRKKEYEKEKGRLNKYRELQKLPPEELQQKVIANYNKFREVATKFYEQYKEANELAAGAAEINYNGSYKDLVRSFGQFIIDAIKIKIGSLFGHVRTHGGVASNIAEFIEKGLNIFSIHALNYELKMYELNNAIQLMKSIMVEYEQYKKLLLKLPDKVNAAVNSFLRKKDSKEFLKWMDEYFPDSKQDFIDNSIKRLISNYAYSTDEDLKLEHLLSFKTYKSVYEKSIHSATTSIVADVRKSVAIEIIESVKNYVNDKASNKLKHLQLLLESDAPYSEFAAYCKKEIGLDLQSILDFAYTVMDNYWKATTAFSPEKIVEKAAEQKKKFWNEFISELKTNISNFFEKSWYFSDTISTHVSNFIKHERDSISMERLKELSKANEKDLNSIAQQVAREVLIASMPNFKKRSGYGGRDTDFPDFAPISEIIRETGRFSISDVTNKIAHEAPEVPKEFWLRLVKDLIKGSSQFGGDLELFENLENMKGTIYKIALHAMDNILKRFGKFNADSFTSIFKRHFKEFVKASSNMSPEFKNVSDDVQTTILTNAIRNMDTISQDIENLLNFLKFKHDEASGISGKDMLRILNNKNFFGFTKNGIARKLIKIYAAIKSRGGAKAIIDKYAAVINKLMERNFVNKSFKKNMNFIVRFFESGEPINPKSESFPKMFKIISSLETDLTTIEMGDALEELMAKFIEKDKRLFDLNLQINDRLRFRVLEGRDPRALRVGIETNCCQRIGGAAESAAKDSFINPLAGVLLLEWKDEEGNWELVGQSYFHYVPKDNGYILDNVEINSTNKYRSRVDVEAAYAYLAQQMKKKDKSISYFLAGKGYSKIDKRDFKSFKMRGGDPRSYSVQGRVYSDFDSRDSINLLAPEKGIATRISTLLPENPSKLAMNLRKQIFKVILAA